MQAQIQLTRIGGLTQRTQLGTHVDMQCLTTITQAHAQLQGPEGLEHTVKQAVVSSQECARQVWDANCCLESHLTFMEEEESNAQAKLKQV